jgi:hypothetical protein
VGQETFAELVASIATAVVEAVDTPAWGGMRRKMIELLGNGDPAGACLAADQLDNTLTRVREADPSRRAEVRAELVANWSRLLRGWAAERPVAAAGLLDARRALGRESLADPVDRRQVVVALPTRPA